MTHLLIHGGAGSIAEADLHAYQAGLRAARDRARRILADGGSAIAAVLAAVCSMEDDPDAFNAGTGGVPNRDGEVECDAAIMCWDPKRAQRQQAEHRCGAVSGLRRARNPVLIADIVRRETPYVLLTGDGADALVDKPIANEALLTDRMRERLRSWRETDKRPDVTNTVGAVARDDAGRLAAATSTGGLLGKWPGRVGDSPLIGAGTWAGPQVAVSCTGVGECFIRAGTARSLELRLEHMDLHAALQAALDDVAAENGHGGLIAICADGRGAYAFNSPQMALGWSCSAGDEALVSFGPGIVELAQRA